MCDFWFVCFAEQCCFNIHCVLLFSFHPFHTSLCTLSFHPSSSQSSETSVRPLPPINSHKSRLNRNQSFPGTSQFKKRTRIPMSNSRRQSIQEPPRPPVEFEAEKIKNSRKYSVKGKVRRKPSERNIDPFQNIGMKIQRF